MYGSTLMKHHVPFPGIAQLGQSRLGMSHPWHKAVVCKVRWTATLALGWETLWKMMMTVRIQVEKQFLIDLHSSQDANRPLP
jgi:hypothetical protein